MSFIYDRNITSGRSMSYNHHARHVFIFATTILLAVIILPSLNGGELSISGSESIQGHSLIAAPGTNSLNEVINKRKSINGRVTILLDEGFYSFTQTVSIPTDTHIVGKGSETILLASPPKPNDKCSIRLSSNSSLQNLTIHNPHANTRRQASANSGVHILRASNTSLERVNIKGSACAGIMIEYSSNINIEECDISKTLADGIHITNASSFVTVRNSNFSNTGDDAIGVVSYKEKADQSHSVLIEGNSIRDGNARGITNIGSRNVTIINNTITDCVGGIYSAYESSYRTYAPSETRIIQNEVLRCGKRTGMHGLFLGSNTDVIVLDNLFMKSRPILIKDSGSGPNRHLVFLKNRITQTIDKDPSSVDIFDTREFLIRDNIFTDKIHPKIRINNEVYTDTP